MIPGVVTAAIVILLGTAGRDLELPHLVVKGTVETAIPMRDFWPSPSGGPSAGARVWEMPIPASTASTGRSVRRVHTSSPVVGFSLSAGGGPWNSGRFTAGFGDHKSGIAVEGWSFEGEEIDHRGIRGAMVLGGRWGSVKLRGWLPSDEYGDEPLADEWAHGELIGGVGLGPSTRLGLRLYGTTAEGDPGHVEGWVRGRLPQHGYGYELVAADRLAGAHLSIDRALDWLTSRVGATAVDDGSEWNYTIDGEVAATPVRTDRVLLGFGARRHLRVVERGALRREFALMAKYQDAVVEDLDWELEAWGALRLFTELSMSARLAQRRFASKALWYAEEDSLHWHAVSAPGRGPAVTGMAQLRIAHQSRVSVGVTYDALEREENESFLDIPVEHVIATTGQWPLVPRFLWWIEATYGRYPLFMLRFERSTDRETLQGTSIASSSMVRCTMRFPLTSTLCAWAAGAYSSGWQFDPWPAQMLSLGMSWSLHGFTKQEATF